MLNGRRIFDMFLLFDNVSVRRFLSLVCLLRRMGITPYYLLCLPHLLGVIVSFASLKLAAQFCVRIFICCHFATDATVSQRKGLRHNSAPEPKAACVSVAKWLPMQRQRVSIVASPVVLMTCVAADADQVFAVAITENHIS